MRTLLGVRKTTATDLCLIESGLPTLQQNVKSMQKKALNRLVEDRLPLMDDPFAHALRIARDYRCPSARYIDSLAAYDPAEDAASLRARVRASTRTKFATYSQLINPSLEVHAMYSSDAVIESHQSSPPGSVCPRTTSPSKKDVGLGCLVSSVCASVDRSKMNCMLYRYHCVLILKQFVKNIPMLTFPYQTFSIILSPKL